MMSNMTKLSTTWVWGAIQAEVRKVGRKLAEPGNKVGPTPAGAERHTINRTG